MSLLHFELAKLHVAAASLLSAASIFSLPQLAIAFILATGFLTLRQWQRRGRVRPAAIWRSLRRSARILVTRSTAADLFYYFVNTFAIAGLIGWGLVSGLAVSHALVHWLNLGFGPRTPSTAFAWTLRAGLTIVAFLGYELGYYIDHVLKHKIPFLWEFHKVHHTAQVLTPLTVFRVHPIDTLIFVDIAALVTGTAHGLFTYAAGRPVDIFALGSGNILTVLCLFGLAHLQHSQFWIPLRGWAGRLLLSPAHHQIHHSIEPAHYNCNLGSFIAVFDWLFGTLEIPPRQSPRLQFGVQQHVENPHRLSELLAAPLLNAAASLKPVRRRPL